MADYITSTSASLHSSPSRKRTRESLAARSSSNLSSSKTAVTITTNSEIMDSSTSENAAPLPSSTQSQDFIHSVKNDHTTEVSKATSSNGIAGSLNGQPKQAPITVNITLFYFYFKCQSIKDISYKWFNIEHSSIGKLNVAENKRDDVEINTQKCPTTVN